MNDLGRRLATQKLDPWLFGFAPDSPPFRMEKFDGKVIQYQGIGFGGSSCAVFWGGFIEPFLEQGIRDVLDRTRERCLAAGLRANRYLDEAADLLRSLVRSTYNRMADIDRRLRSRGGLETGVGVRDVSSYVDRMNQFVNGQLRAAKLLARQPGWSQGTKWVMGIVSALLIAGLGYVLKMAIDWIK